MAANLRGSAISRTSLCFRWGAVMDYMTISEAAEKWNISNRRIQTLCAQGRIEGAVRLECCWLLPKEALKPKDARVKSGKYIGHSGKHKNCSSCGLEKNNQEDQL